MAHKSRRAAAPFTRLSALILAVIVVALAQVACAGLKRNEGPPPRRRGGPLGALPPPLGVTSRLPLRHIPPDSSFGG